MCHSWALRNPRSIAVVPFLCKTQLASSRSTTATLTTFRTTYWFTVIDDTELLAGINGSENDYCDINALTFVWKPLYRDVERLLDIFGR